MRNAIKKKKLAPMLCAGVVLGIMAIYLAAFFYAVTATSYGETLATIVLILYVLIITAVIVGVFMALRQRLREIDGGEEEDAKIY